MSYARIIPITLGKKYAGLNLRAIIYAQDGVTALTGDLTTGFTEMGGGDYQWYYDAFPDHQLLNIQFFNDDTDDYLGFAVVNFEDWRDDFAIDSVVVDGSPAAGHFCGGSILSPSIDNVYRGMVLVFTSGPLQGQNRKVSAYVSSLKQFLFLGAPGSVDEPFPTAPNNGDPFRLIGRIA